MIFNHKRSAGVLWKFGLAIQKALVFWLAESHILSHGGLTFHVVVDSDGPERDMAPLSGHVIFSCLARSKTFKLSKYKQPNLPFVTLRTENNQVLKLSSKVF